MSLRKLFLLSMAAALCLGRPAFSEKVIKGIQIGNGKTAEITGGKTAYVKIIDADGAELASIPIEKNPDIVLEDSPGFKMIFTGNYLYSVSNNTLYIVHDIKFDEHFISAVNLTTYRVDKLIKAEEGIVILFVSGDGHRLFCYTNGKHDTEPVIKVYDTASYELIATYSGFDTFDQVVKSKRQSGFFCKFMAADGDDLIVETGVSRFWNMRMEEYADHIVGFSGLSSKPRFSIDAGGTLNAIMFSKDKKYLFGTNEGNKNTEGSFSVFDLEKGTSFTHALTGHPTMLLRFGTKQEPWILGSEEMRAFSETGELTDKRIQLSKSNKSEANSETGASVFLDGYPGETISLGDDHAAILIAKRNGLSQHKVALIDLKKLQVDAIIPTMSAGEIAGIRTGRYFAALGMSLATGGTVMFTPNWVLRNESLAGRPDGRFLFALDLEGHVITVVDVQTASVVRRIPVNNTVTRLQVSADGKHLICFGKKAQQINLETNELEN